MWCSNNTPTYEPRMKTQTLVSPSTCRLHTSGGYLAVNHTWFGNLKLYRWSNSFRLWDTNLHTHTSSCTKLLHTHSLGFTASRIKAGIKPLCPGHAAAVSPDWPPQKQSPWAVWWKWQTRGDTGDSGRSQRVRASVCHVEGPEGQGPSALTDSCS